MKHALWLLAVFSAGLPAATMPADSDRGAQLFESLHCIQCHSVNGKGATIGPDLGRRVGRNFTPASLAATMWNHAPAMWVALRARGIEIGDLNEQASADLFAYFYAARFFEKPGDAGRGKHLFSVKHCTECHGLKEAKLPAAKPVSKWESIGNPIDMVNAMWNHAATMRQEFANRKLKWPELTSQDLTDMVVYLRNSTGNTSSRVEITPGLSGEALFEAKGCGGCHTANRLPGARRQGRTLTDIAVDMWNHEPRMKGAAPPLQLGEMRELTSYLWAADFFEDSGNASAGARVFVTKQCAGCHENASSGAPKLVGAGRTYSGASVVSALWHHGPAMLAQMKAKGIDWPRFESQEMSNLIAYLNGSKPRK